MGHWVNGRGVGCFLVMSLASWGLGGCEDTPESTARKESARAVDQAGRLLRASHQQLVQGSLPGRSVEGELETVVETVMPALDNLLPEDYAGLRQVCGRIQEAEQSLAAQYAAMQKSATDKNRQRIDKAKSLLEKVVGRGTGDLHVELVPRLMLGALYLMVARDYRQELRRGDTEIQAQQIALGRLTSEVTLTRVYAGLLPEYYPHEETIVKLLNRLEGEPALTGEPESLQSQLKRVNDEINTLMAKKEQIAGRLKTHRRQAKGIDRRYFGLLKRAEQTNGQEQYDLKRQAYQLRTGGQNGPDGGLYHEEQSQLLEYQLATLEQKLAIDQFSQAHLTESIRHVNESVTALEASPIIENIQTSIEASDVYEALHISRLSAQLEALVTMEEAYESLRVEAVGAYSAARQAFSAAAQQAGSGERATREHARAMAAAVDRELADPQYDPTAPENSLKHAPGLWQEDAQHYASLLEALALLDGIEGVEQEVTGLLQTYAGRAQQAWLTITELVEQGE